MFNRRPRVLLAIAVLVAGPYLVPVTTQPAAKRPVEIEDVIAWKTIGSTVLSADGAWFGYRLAPQEGDAEIVLKRVRGDGKEWRFPAGEQPQGDAGGGRGGAAGAASTLAFSDDGAFAAFTTYPTRAAAQRMRRQRRPIQSSVTLVNLATGEKKEYPRIRRFAFSGESSGWIALHRFGPETPAGGGANAGGAAAAGGGRAGGGAAADRPRGTDLILRALASTAELNVGNVSEFSFRKDGRLLAFAIDATDKAGNGLQLRDMTSGVVTPIDSASATYERISWSDKGDALAVLRGTDNRAFRDKLYAVVGVTDVAGRLAEKSRLRSGAGFRRPEGTLDQPEPLPVVDGRSAGADLRPLRAASA